MATLDTIQYQIVNLDTQLGQIQVKYFTSIFTDGLIYNIDLPITNGATVSDQDLTTLINQFAPIGQLTDIENQKAFQDQRKQLTVGVDFSHIQAKVVAPVSASPTMPAQTQTMWQNIEFQKAVGDVLVKAGLVQTNPITIPVSTQ